MQTNHKLKSTNLNTKELISHMQRRVRRGSKVSLTASNKPNKNMAAGQNNKHTLDLLQSSSTTLKVTMIMHHISQKQLSNFNSTDTYWKCGDAKHRQGFNCPTNNFHCKTHKKYDLSHQSASTAKENKYLFS